MRTKLVAATALMALALASPSLAQNNGYYRHHHRHNRSTTAYQQGNGYQQGTQGTWNASNANRYGVTIPAGTPINVRLNTNIATDDAHAGDPWSGTVSQSVVAGDRVMIPAGSPVEGVIANVSQGTHSDPAQLDLAVRTVTVDGQTRSMTADTDPIVGGSSRAKKLGAVAGGAAAGALLGHTVARGNHGTLIGGLIGGAAGYGLTRNAFRTLQLKPGTVVTFTTREGMVARRY
jgi:hypothetical protein